MVDTTLVVRCDTCTYRLAYPDFFLNAKKSALRKLLKWMYRYGWQNTDTIRFLEQEMPKFTATIEARGRARVEKSAERLQACTAEYERIYLDPDPAKFPIGLTKEQIRSEKQSRKDWNTRHLQPVKNAKADYEKAKKEAKDATERAKQIYDLFLSEKPKI